MTNIYAPNDDNPAVFLNRSQKIEDISNENQIISGDFNLVFSTANLALAGFSLTNPLGESIPSRH